MLNNSANRLAYLLAVTGNVSRERILSHREVMRTAAISLKNNLFFKNEDLGIWVNEKPPLREMATVQLVGN